jgi:hypothetical protein
MRALGARVTLSARLELTMSGLVAGRRRQPPPITGESWLGELRMSARLILTSYEYCEGCHSAHQLITYAHFINYGRYICVYICVYIRQVSIVHYKRVRVYPATVPTSGSLMCAALKKIMFTGARVTFKNL